MDPTLGDGQHVMVNKLAYYQLDLNRLARLIPFWDVEEGSRKHLPFTRSPNRGDVIVFHDPNTPGRDLVKRVVGLPGESVKIIEGVLYIDGVELDESYLDGVHASGSMECIPNSVNCVLEEDEYFVMGDNRARSSDSRHWGPIGLNDIAGKVWFGY